MTTATSGPGRVVIPEPLALLIELARTDTAAVWPDSFRAEPERLSFFVRVRRQRGVPMPPIGRHALGSSEWRGCELRVVLPDDKELSADLSSWGNDTDHDGPTLRLSVAAARHRHTMPTLRCRRWLRAVRSAGPSIGQAKPSRTQRQPSTRTSSGPRSSGHAYFDLTNAGCPSSDTLEPSIRLVESTAARARSAWRSGRGRAQGVLL